MHECMNAGRIDLTFGEESAIVEDEYRRESLIGQAWAIGLTGLRDYGLGGMGGGSLGSRMYA